MMNHLNQQGLAKTVVKFLAIGAFGGAGVGLTSCVFVERSADRSLAGALYGGAGGFVVSVVLSGLVFWDRKALTSRYLPDIEQLAEQAQSMAIAAPVPSQPAVDVPAPQPRRLPQPPRLPQQPQGYPTQPQSFAYEDETDSYLDSLQLEAGGQSPKTQYPSSNGQRFHSSTSGSEEDGDFWNDNVSLTMP